MRTIAAIIALVAGAHVGLWALTEPQADAPDVVGRLASVSYAPFARSAHPDRGDRPTEKQIRADLEVLAPYTRAIRTYSSTGGVELVAPIAADFNLKVAVGAWLDKNQDRNERELKAAIELARNNSNVNALVVGNETIYRDDIEVDELIKVIRQVKRQTSVPVTTGEIYSVWLENPKLASAVDFIAAHILPYWEGFSDAQAVNQTLIIYEQLRRAYPGKRIVIAEFGWPSAGYNMHAAKPGRAEQAKVLRDFVARAQALGIDYNIVEAIDQPWKTNEGGVGPYWGLIDAYRQVKFPWSGSITSPDHWKIAGLAALLGLLLSLPLLKKAGATVRQTTLMAIAANIVAAWFATVFAFWNGHYFVTGASIALGIGLTLLIPLVVIAFARIEEIAAIAFGKPPRRLISSPALMVNDDRPMVSIHVPAYREPPEMLKATLDAVARLDYPNFECVVVINNTPDPAFWQPVAEHCRALGDRFKFVNVEKLAGFKAGALRLALDHTAVEAEIIGVIDADYVVQPDWLKDLVPDFADPTVGLIQAPQDHRDGNRSVMHHAMNGEYAGFFDIGMVQRNETNAIIVHGTMCLIRRAAIDRAGGWSSDTICEDTDLGLTILEQGWQAKYTNRRYGYGLLPDTYEAYAKQRHRWAYGGLEIVKKHWRSLLPGHTRLTNDQKRGFAVGWLNWLGAETIGVAVAILNLLWVPVVAFVGIAVPDKILTIPIIAIFLVSVVHFVSLYSLRVAIRPSQMVGAVFAAMAVQWTVARAVAIGLFKEGLPFMRTAKGGATRKGPDFPAFWEAVLGTLLIVGAITLVATNYKQITEINVFALVLVLQSLPFLASAGIAALDGSRFNEFAYWRGLETRLAEFLSRRGAAQKATAQLPAKNRFEATP
jgi:exo-beta-1,3-glucanase (GH17 family)/cellulose synthase/poly-beta-1,6-N-acetylglucosamine synthase-like glycosyltransferase